MPEPLKNMYNENFLRKLGLDIKSVYSPFNVEGFVKSTMDETWESLELKERMRKITVGLKEYLPADYEAAIKIMEQVAPKTSFGLFFPDFVEVYGQDESDWDLSMYALEKLTEYPSSEFAVRPFIISNKERMMEKMYHWSKSENEHVRRLASEGCRPQLPWAQALNSFKKDPTPILPILEQLKVDSSKYVRKSVANNMNDISKTHPELVVKLAKDWYGENKGTDWIVKHGCRTLLKKGNPEILAIFGYHDVSSIDVRKLALSKATTCIGEDIHFSFTISSKKATKIRMEYGVDYMKSNGKRSRKIFQISEISLKENEKKDYKRKHSFEDLSTRKHYPGLHSITLIVNGREQGTLDFELKL